MGREGLRPSAREILVTGWDLKEFFARTKLNLIEDQKKYKMVYTLKIGGKDFEIFFTFSWKIDLYHLL